MMLGYLFYRVKGMSATAMNGMEACSDSKGSLKFKSNKLRYSAIQMSTINESNKYKPACFVLNHFVPILPSLLEFDAEN